MKNKEGMELLPFARKDVIKIILEYNTISEYVIRLCIQPFNMVIIQVFATANDTE